MSSKRTKWSEEEKKELQRIVQNEWEYNFPEYRWVAGRLNSMFNNNRTSKSVISMCRRYKF